MTPDPIQITLEQASDEELFSVFLDEIALTTTGWFTVEGWAIARSGIAKLDVLVDDLRAGEAICGRPRPDVGQNYPDVERADFSGFALQTQLPASFQGRRKIILLLHSAGGGFRVATTVVEVTEAAPASRVEPADDGSLKLEVDRPKLSGKRVLETIRGGLQIEGWALARDGVAAIEVLLDGQPYDTAKYGMRREDVGKAFPGWDSSRLSGYALPIPARALATGEHLIQVELLSRTGQRKRTDFRIECDQPIGENSPASLRTRISAAETQIGANVLAGLGWRPHFTIILQIAAADTALLGLDRSLTSLQNQAYDDWHCIICGDLPGERATVNQFLRSNFAPICQRIAILPEAANGLVVDVVAAITGSPGDLVGLISAGDMLGCDALLEMAVESGLHPEAEFLYSDERRPHPLHGAVAAFFKPQWSPDLLLATNYIGRLWCAEPELLARVGARIEDLKEFGEYDLVLHLTEAARGIHRLARVLCERGSALLDEPETERKALARALSRQQTTADLLDGFAPGYYQVRRKRESRGLVSIIIPTCAAAGRVKTCIETLRAVTAGATFEIVCVENIPPDRAEWREWLAGNVDKLVSLQEPFNWSRFNNLAARQAEGEFLVFLNDDIEIIEPDWLVNLTAHGERREVGAVGARLLYPDGKVQHAGMFWSGGGGRHAFRFAPASDPGYFGLAVTTRNCLSVTGACILMRREWFDAIGGFDEGHAIVNNDVDLCLRCWQNGGLVVYEPAATLVHHELASRADMADDYDTEGFSARWSGVLSSGDPFYHPYLARDLDDFSLDEEPVQFVYAGHPLFTRSALRRILVSKLDHLGDFITAVPAIERLCEHFPEAEIYLLAPPGSAVLAGFLPRIKEVINFEFFFARSGLGERQVTEADLIELKSRLERYRFDLAIDLRKGPDTREVLRHTGARWLAGYDRDGRFPWLDIALEWEGDDRLIAKRSHVGDDLSRLVEAVAVAADQRRQVLSLPDRKALTVSGESGKPTVCVHPGAGMETKRWSVAQFTGLIDLLVAVHDVSVILIGGADERPFADDILASVKHRTSVRSLVGELPLSELSAVLASAVLFVGNDSGPKHIAAGLGVPTVGIHSGVADTREWGPVGPNAIAVRRDMRCSPCYLGDVEACPRSLACLTELGVWEVYEACRRLLAIHPPAGGTSTRSGPEGKQTIFVHPGVGTETRQWPAAQFAALIDLLVVNHDVDIVLIGSHDETAIVDEVLASVQHRALVRSLVGETRLIDLPAVLASAALFVGNNSGPKHIAAGLGVPTIGIHSGVKDAREWGPIGPNALAVRRDMRCSPCNLAELDDCPRSFACMTELNAADVYQACRRLLAIRA